ncbi:DUF1877 family protein [Streptomyces sp. NPDC059168]|uniref:DUF1877 family protein n=1 Tax=Streptomyces sp. NPDC059168 TaxID=3346753 RepID=UPI0036BC37F2
MSTYLQLRAVPPSALRNSGAWMERMLEGDPKSVRGRIGRHREEVLDVHCLDQERIYLGVLPGRAEDRPENQVVLGGRPVFTSVRHKPPFLVLTAAQTRRVAAFLTAVDFDALWESTRDALLPRYGGPAAEADTRRAFAETHRELREFYAQTATEGDAVVKWTPGPIW